MLTNLRNLGLAGTVAFIVAYVLVGAAVKGLFRKAGPDVRSEAFLAQIANEANKTLPRALDTETEITSVTGLAGVLVYGYRLVNVSAERLAPKELKEGLISLKAALQPRTTKSACSLPETKDTFLKKGVTLRYSYADKERRPLMTFDVSPRDCGF